jgi:2-iminobutanoate/2-iminopropanoate deaminase
MSDVTEGAVSTTDGDGAGRLLDVRLGPKRRLMPESHWDWSIPSPFSQGWRIGNLVFVGGQLSADENGECIGRGDIEVQTRNTFENITRVLEEAGASWKDVVKINTYYTYDGPEDEAGDFWRRMTAVRMEYLPDPGPCGTAVRVNGFMSDGFLIEVEVIAVVTD